VRLAAKGGNNQGRLTLIFNIISCGLHSRAAYNRVNTVDLENTVLQLNEKYYTQVNEVAMGSPIAPLFRPITRGGEASLRIY